MQISHRRDVATVVSLLPVALNEKKPGIYPGTFLIEAAERGDVKVLVVRESFHYVPQLENKPYQAITVAGEIAKSIVNDYKEGSLGRDEDAEPGLFWVYGEYSPELAKIELREEILNATVLQNRWYVNLVRIGDIEWSKAPNNHNVITDMMRYAATGLGLEKEWLVDIQNLAMVYCPACHANVSSKAVICGACSCILKPEEHAKFTFAKV